MAQILVVDDDPYIPKLVELYLRQQNHKFHMASNGEQALALALQILPDLIISDIVMPVMDGPTFVAEFWERSGDRHVPVIFFTGLITKEEEQMQREVLGNRFFLAKPFTAEQLGDLVAQALG